jgi:hypothetical protein
MTQHSEGQRNSSSPRARLALEQLENRLVLSVSYGGGPLLTHPNVEALFYGAQWNTDSTLVQQASQIDDFLSTIVDSAYMDMLAPYRVGRGVFLDSQIDTSTPPATIDDTALQQILAQDINSGLLDGVGGNSLYFIFTAPGTEVTFTDAQGNLNTSGTEANDAHFYGYHDAILGTLRTPAVYYAVIPYPGGVNGTEDGLSTFDQITVAASHELVEVATDPDTQTGWLDPTQVSTNGGEIADLANGEYGPILGYQVQYVWSNELNTPILPEPANLLTAAKDFTQSVEQYTNVIVNDYQQLLGRTPAQAEINGWLQSFDAGMTDERAEAIFLASPEFFQKAGGTNQAWVDSLYQNVLNRQADAGGQAAWLNALAHGTSRTTIALDFTTSTEHEAALIQADYQLYLGRTASSAEVSSWVVLVQHGTTQEQMAADFLASAEAFFIDNSSSIDNWIDFAYETVLNREADPAGDDFWSNYLNNGLT